MQQNNARLGFPHDVMDFIKLWRVFQNTIVECVYIDTYVCDGLTFMRIRMGTRCGQAVGMPHKLASSGRCHRAVDPDKEKIMVIRRRDAMGNDLHLLGVAFTRKV